MNVGQLDNGNKIRICPHCHAAILYLLPEHPAHEGYKCPLCGFTLLVKRKRHLEQDPDAG